MIHGILFDAYPDYKKNQIITWILTPHGPKKIQETYQPSFYVYASSSELHTLASQLHAHPHIKEVTFTDIKTTLGLSRASSVLQIIPEHLARFHELAHMIDTWGNFYKYQLYNVDLRLSTRYLHHKNVFFNAHVTWTGKQFILNDEQWAVDYPSPLFSTVTLAISRKKQHRIPSSNDCITTICINEYVIEEENEKDCILTALKTIQNIDPDIIYTLNGDSIMFPFLFERARRHDIHDQFILSRDRTVPFFPVKQASSYVSYGRIIHRPAFYTLAGRAHIDTGNSFFYSECGLSGLLDVSRCANISLQMLSRLGAGTAISQIQINTARREGYGIPWKKTQPEHWKTASELLTADRGGLILDPFVGVHENVIELDYASLYPNIMLHHNISPETILCPCCPDSPHRVPQLHYHICIEKKGLLPLVLLPILDRRFLFKARSKNTSYDHQRYQQLQQAWKWVLLVCFGYTGYRNARYGRIECHESITAFSREILISAMHLAEQSGYEVLHGIIDSLWIKPYRPDMNPHRLARCISQHTGIRIVVEGRYHWIVFLPNKGTGVGALNRYYGLFDTGELKVRGVELRQHQTPRFFKQMQQQMFAVLQKAHTSDEIHCSLPEIFDVALSAAKQLTTGTIDSSDLIITTRVTQDVMTYKVDTAVKAALQQLQDVGVHIHPGQMVQYVVANEHATSYSEKICLSDVLAEETPIDRSFYLRYLARCVETILSPFGYTMDTILKSISTSS
ncbi:MAG: DNA polymerase domain-containing protein [Thermoplasmatota archaeon]